MTITWFRYISESATPLTAEEFAARVPRVANATMLGVRPGITDFWRPILGAALVAVADAGGLRVSFPSHPNPKKAAAALGIALNARPEETDEPDAFALNVKTAHAWVPRSAELARVPKSRGEAALRPEPPQDGYVAWTVRRLGFVETDRLKRWVSASFNSQGDSSHLRETSSAALRISAGAPKYSDAKMLIVEAGGALNLGVPVTTHLSRPGLGGLLLSLLLTAVGVGLSVAMTWAHGYVGFIPATIWPAIIPALAIIPAAVRWRMVSDVRHAVMQSPRHRWWGERMRKADSSDKRSRNGGLDTNAADAVEDYPFQRSTLPCPPTTLFSALLPERRKEASHASLTQIATEMSEHTGPLIGTDAAGSPARLDHRQMYGGVAVLGSAGGGKSNLIQGLLKWTWDSTQSAVIDFETKNGTALPRLHRLSGARAVTCAPMDPNTPMIDILGPGTPEQRAAAFADLVKYGSEEGSVQYRSLQQLSDAALVGQYLASRAGEMAGVPEHAGWLHVAYAALGGYGLTAARDAGRLAQSSAEQSISQASIRLAGERNATTGRWQISDARLMESLDAPRNKVKILLDAAPAWDPRRSYATWDQILVGRRHVLVDTGTDMPPQTGPMLGAMLLKSLRDAFVRVAPGWQDKGLNTVVACDELSLLAGSDDAVLEWFREKGRDFGVQVIFGTQSSEQLSPALRNSFLGYVTVAAFRLDNPLAAAAVAEVLDDGTGQWTAARVRSLPTYSAALRTLGSHGPLPTAIVAVPLTEA